MGNETSRSTVFDSGLTLVTRHAKKAATTDIVIKTLAGSRYEVAGNYPRGVSHFGEHMLCKGSTNYPYPARKLIEGIEGFDESAAYGHNFSPATQFDFTNYSASVPAASTHAVLDIMCDMISRPNIHDRDVEVERKYIINERIMNQLSFNSSNLQKWVVPYVAHGKNPLLYPVIGDIDSIKKISASDIREFYIRNVTSNRTVIAVEGLVEHDDIVKIVHNRVCLPWGLRPSGEAPVYTGGDERYWLPGEGGAHIALAFKAPREGDFKAGIAFKVASRLLTAKFGKHSIPEALRSDQLGVYDHVSFTSQNVDSGLMTITFKAVEVQPCLETIHRILFDLTKNVDAKALALVRADQVKRIELSQDLFKVGADDLAGDIFLHNRIMPPDHYARLRLGVTEDEIKNAVCEMLSHPVTFAAAGDLAPLPPPHEVRSFFLYRKKEDYSRSSASASAQQQYACG